MRRISPILIGVAALYLIGLVLGAFLIKEPAPIWVSFLVWLGAGVLLTFATKPSRWWVCLGFLCLGAAWVEAGQAVWLERTGSASDVCLGCLASGIGVGIAMTARALSLRSASRSIRARTAGATPHR